MGSRAIHTVTMKYFAVLLSVATCYAAPAADADPQLLLGGYHGLLGAAPVVHHVGYNVHHQVHHVPQVSVQKHVQTYTTQHVINHAPVVGAYHGLAPLAVAAPAVAVAAEAEVAAE